MNIIRVPVLLGFDHTKAIGFMEVDADQLPGKPNYCFALGYAASSIKDGEVQDYNLYTIGVVSDNDYANLLRAAGVAK